MGDDVTRQRGEHPVLTYARQHLSCEDRVHLTNTVFKYEAVKQLDAETAHRVLHRDLFPWFPHMPGGVVQWFQQQEADLGHAVAAGLRVR